MDVVEVRAKARKGEGVGRIRATAVAAAEEGPMVVCTCAVHADRVKEDRLKYRTRKLSLARVGQRETANLSHIMEMAYGTQARQKR